MKVYRGYHWKVKDQACIMIRHPNGKVTPLPQCDYPRHPWWDGWEWLEQHDQARKFAYDLIVSATGSHPCAEANYIRLSRHIANAFLPDTWELRQEDIIAWVDTGIPIGTL